MNMPANAAGTGAPDLRDDAGGPAEPGGLVGLVGLGLVGTAIGARLVAAGFRLIGFDRSEAAQAAWTRRGGSIAPSLADLGRRCSCVVLAVYDTEGVRQVAESADGVLAALPGAAPASAVPVGGVPVSVEGSGAAVGPALRTLVDCSTGDPDALQALAGRLAARGVALIEAPLSGSSAQIAAGEATMLLGGDAQAVAAQARLLGAIAAHRIHVGGAGMGARAKLATNLVLGLNRAALAEGLVFAQALGIAPATFLALVLATPARSDAALAKGAQMVEGDFAPRSRIHQHLKDVTLMLASARAAGQPLPLTEAHAALLRAAVQAGDGDLDNAAIVRQLRREGGRA